MKHEWRKHEKEIYLPKSKPVFINIPKFKYYTITGKGNPNSDDFKSNIEALYSASYGIRMSEKQGLNHDSYFEYTVYPLEGEWTLSEKGIELKQSGTLMLDELEYKLMIRQPEFVSNEIASDNLNRVYEKKKLERLKDVKFEELEDGLSVQMIHVGPYATESKTFAIMESHCKENGLSRTSYDHREIYISDPRKGDENKMKTLLRFSVKYD